ncbi:hypothetical protein D3C72_1448780 [compost metagenome]
MRTFTRLLQIIGNAAAAHPRFRRVVTEHHHQLAVFDVRRAVAFVAAIGIGHGAGDLRCAVGAILAEVTAIAVHQPSDQRRIR